MAVRRRRIGVGGRAAGKQKAGHHRGSVVDGQGKGPVAGRWEVVVRELRRSR